MASGRRRGSQKPVPAVEAPFHPASCVHMYVRACVWDGDGVSQSLGREEEGQGGVASASIYPSIFIVSDPFAVGERTAGGKQNVGGRR